jgi:hypothetical protein
MKARIDQHARALAEFWNRGLPSRAAAAVPLLTAGERSYLAPRTLIGRPRRILTIGDQLQGCKCHAAQEDSGPFTGALASELGFPAAMHRDIAGVPKG